MQVCIRQTIDRHTRARLDSHAVMHQTDNRRSYTGQITANQVDCKNLGRYRYQTDRQTDRRQHRQTDRRKEIIRRTRGSQTDTDNTVTASQAGKKRVRRAKGRQQAVRQLTGKTTGRLTVMMTMVQK